MYMNKEFEEFLNWCKKNNKFTTEIREIYINDNGVYKTEKREVEVLDSNPKLICEYEKSTGKKLN